MNKKGLGVGKQTEGVVYRRFGDFFSRFLLLFELQQECFCGAWVQPVVTPFLRMFYHALRGARMTLYVVLCVAVDFDEVRLEEEGTIMIVDVLGQLFHADATHAYL